MAMNKAEKAEMENLRQALALSRALHFPDYPVPQPMTIGEIKENLVDGGVKWGSAQKVARGWFISSYLSGSDRQQVQEPTYGCSDGINHNRQGDTTTSQTPGTMYATKEEAIMALRHEVTTKVAHILAYIDSMLEQT